MNGTAYIGEHTWAGQLGHVLALVSLVGALLALLGYVWSEQRGQDAGWRTVGRIGFRAHSMAVLGIVALLFVMLFNHWFEYDYVWKHSNRQMPMRYIASCFWEGQEGSFLLWTFWHMVLGNILIRSAGRWEAPVLAVVAAVQVFLATMLLGIYVGDVRIGSSPFLLIRELPENLGKPWTLIPDYLSRIPEFADGRGLNPLLQNYWMVIHPPTLFLGFAAVLVPFAYAIAGLWRRDLSGWIKPALPWTFFGVTILGTGILMGGAWAYEALSFGGFWAWDPVENASLVPWLTLVGAGHLMLINQGRQTSLFSTFLLTLMSFHLVLYSSFLTRSGVLGDTSVHSFTGDGMLPGLLVFMLAFVALATLMLHPDRALRRFYGGISAALLVIGVLLDVPVGAIVLFGLLSVGMVFSAYGAGFRSDSTEEALWSREFWLFIGSLVLLLSAAQITWSTSVPVFNLLLEPLQQPLAAVAGEGDGFLARLSQAQLAPPGDPIPHYNKWQLPFAFIVALLVAVGQYLRYRDSDMRMVLRKLAVPMLVAAVITGVVVWLLGYRFRELNLIALLFATAFAFTANAGYIRSGLKGRWANAGPSIAHVGFALVLLGALVSTSRRTEVSQNVQGMDLRLLNEEFSNSTDVLLYRGDTVRMGEHYVTFDSKRQEAVNLYFGMAYLQPEPRQYRRGDTVRVRETLFVARNDHTASDNFLADQPAHWEPVERHPRRALWNARQWSPTMPGEKLFRLEPFVQLNPRFGNVAEPSTKHWPHRDLYTHIRYADLSMDNLEAAGDTGVAHYMPPRTYKKQLGDTIVTPTSLVLLDSVKVVRDSVTLAMLGPEYTVYALRMRVRDLYDRERWFDARPVVIYRDGQPVANKAAEVAPLRVKYELAAVDQDRIELNVYEHEFVVMQALIFPGINILWIGCVLLFVGSLLAVVQRVRRQRKSKAERT
jgi:cytochrome c-type biogenesis protein CcmF